MLHQTVEVVENSLLAERTYRVRLRSPELARVIEPGQFLMLRLPTANDPLLGRPFALFDVVDEAGEPTFVEVVYLVVGKMTTKLATVRPGEGLTLWGPLGRRFPEFRDVAEVNLVAGGIGQTPFLAYGRELLGRRGFGGSAPQRQAERVRLFYGVRTAGLAAGLDDFRRAGLEVHLASDDGSLGRRGFVTTLFADSQPHGPVVGCGPEPMLHALGKLTTALGLRAWVSLETPMACGIGACFSCVAKVRTPDGVDWKRVCVDGPTFAVDKLAWS